MSPATSGQDSKPRDPGPVLVSNETPASAASVSLHAAPVHGGAHSHTLSSPTDSHSPASSPEPAHAHTDGNAHTPHIHFPQVDSPIAEHAHRPSSLGATSSQTHPQSHHRSSHRPSTAGSTSRNGRPSGRGRRRVSSREPLDEDDREFFFPERRRVRSEHSQSRPPATLSRSRFVAIDGLATGPSGRSRPSTRRVASSPFEYEDIENALGAGAKAGKRVTSVGSSPLARGSLLPRENGDEPDDPNILADLHKALKYKSHVEKQLKEGRSASPSLVESVGPQIRTPPNLTLSKRPYTSLEPFSPTSNDFVDFSPSVGKSRTHPVPTSINDGATLDWSGVPSDDEKREKRWSMSAITHRSSKDKSLASSRKGVIEKQEAIFSDKLSRIRSRASDQTLHKAEIVKDQLKRRYNMLSSTRVSSPNGLNLAIVARWHSKQDIKFKVAVDDAEPLTWLRHLQRRRTDSRRSRSPWILSALTVEEYFRANGGNLFSSPVSMDGVSDTGSLVPVNGPARFEYVGQREPRPAEFTSSRKASDGPLSFEPAIYSRRSSLGRDSRGSLDTQFRKWRQSLVSLGKESAEGSPRSSLQERSPSEAIDLHGLRPIQLGIRALGPLNSFPGINRASLSKRSHSDDGQISNVDSLSEDAAKVDDAIRTKGKAKQYGQEAKKGRFRISLDVLSSPEDAKERLPPLNISDLRTDASVQKRQPSSSPGTIESTSLSLGLRDASLSPKKESLLPAVLNSVQEEEVKKNSYLGLPTGPAAVIRPLRKPKVSLRTTEVSERDLRVEYARKKELLDALRIRNSRLRSSLQTASRFIVEYDDTMHTMAESLAMPYNRLPQDLLEALSHDLAAVTSSARRMRGWRAVEDIHLRLERQKDILETFVESISETIRPLNIPKAGIYNNALTRLADLVNQLHIERSKLLPRVQDATELLNRVKKLRDVLIPEFDTADRHTSANYPELVYLESLVDELTGNTNKLWKIAEAFVSFILTSIAPIMKTFGRPVWNELHDFLVIPIYRNGFSGEEDWYPVKFPPRSLTHWLRLLLVAAGIPIFLQHGARIFIDLLTQGYLLRVPAFIPTFIVYCLFSGLMCAFAFTLLILLFAMFCESVIILWWTGWFLCIVK